MLRAIRKEFGKFVDWLLTGKAFVANSAICHCCPFSTDAIRKIPNRLTRRGPPA
jgi:hypothetical protein